MASPALALTPRAFLLVAMLWAMQAPCTLAQESSAGEAATPLAEHLAKGAELLRFGRVADALFEFAIARRISPENLDAHLGYQDCKLARGGHAELVSEYEARHAEQPDDRDRHYLAARVRERIEDRIDDLTALVARYPEFVRAQLDLGRAQVRAGRLPAASATFAQVEKQRPGETAAILGQGIVRRMRGDSEGAVREFVRVLSQDPKNSEAHHHLALVHLAANVVMRGRGGEASRRTVATSSQVTGERHLLRALELDPDNFDARADLARLYSDMRRSREARKLLLEHMQAHPRDPRAYVQLSEYDVAEGLSEIAEQHLIKILNLCPDDPDIHVNLGVIYAGQGRALDAEEHFRKAVELHPRLGAGWVDLGHVYMGMGSFRLAVHAFEKALSCTDILEDEVWPNLARGHARFGRFLRDEASRLLAEAENGGVGEDGATAQQTLQVQGLERSATEHLTTARRYYLQALESQPEHGALRMELGKVNLNLQDGAAAIEQFRAALTAPAERPSEEEITYLTAVAYMELGDHINARAQIDRTLFLNEKHRGALELRHALARSPR